MFYSLQNYKKESKLLKFLVFIKYLNKTGMKKGIIYNYHFCY